MWLRKIGCVCQKKCALSALTINCSLSCVMRQKTLHVDWKSIAGAAVKKRMLKMEKDAEGLFQCPIAKCLHIGFKSDRGLRKHVNTSHPWYLYFDEQPLINRNEVAIKDEVRRKSSTHNVPAFSLTDGTGKDFLDWLKTPCGGGKTKKQAVQVGRRGMKFLMVSIGDTEVDKHVSDELIDCCLGSPAIVINFFKLATEDWRLSSSAALNYMKAVNDLMDFRKANGVTDDVLRSFAVTEVYIRRGKENLSKQKKLEYSRNLDLEQLICRKSWATVEEMEKVIPYHTPKYKYVLDQCKKEEGGPTISQLAFATRFIATFLFLRVKCTRPMTYQYITLKMVENAKINGGFIDQTSFKTELQYAFDTLILSEDVLQVIDSYIATIRPRLMPKCEFLLLTTNGKQYTALGSAMSILVHQAIEKYVNPTRYRQIIESESAERLTPEEMDAVSKDQKHSSYVAKRIYQKKLSREVAAQGRSCMEKIVGTRREEHTKEIASIVNCNVAESPTTPTISTGDVEEIMSIINSTSLSAKEEEIEIDCKEDLLEGSSGATSFESPSQPEEVTPASKGEEGALCKLSAVGRSTRSTSSKPQREVEVKKEEVEERVEGIQCQKRFCPEEDKALREGVKKHGAGKWSVMLRDKTLLFAESRTRDSLRMRANTLGLCGKKKKMRKSNSK